MDLTHNSQSMHSFILTVMIFKSTCNIKCKYTPYDIHLFIGRTRKRIDDTNFTSVARCGMDRELMFYNTIPMLKYCALDDLTVLMKKKFGSRMTHKHKQMVHIYKSDNEHAFLHIDAPIKWIKSILNVEVDYHIGEQHVLHENNKKYLDDYLTRIDAGYGDRWIDTEL